MKHKHHIIPKHMGGTDDPSNLISLTPGEHAEAHRLLYEKHGHWQDYVAWQGLAQLDANFDAAKESMLAGSRKGRATMVKNRKGKKWEEIHGVERATQMRKEFSKIRSAQGKTWTGKVYDVTHPDGTVERVEGLRQWCMDRGYNANAFANASLRGNKTHGGFMVKQA